MHLVMLEELFPKIWVRDLKTACGRCDAHAKFENNAKCFRNLEAGGHVMPLMRITDAFLMRALQDV